MASLSFIITFTSQLGGQEVDSVRSRVATGYQPKSLKASAQYVQDQRMDGLGTVRARLALFWLEILLKMKISIFAKTSKFGWKS